ncbi:MAG TPA: hypothetical protein VF406_05965 [Thermodesulfobacteriota bacterium]
MRCLARASVFAVLFLIAPAAPALAQSEVAGWLSPRIGGLAPRADYRIGQLDDRPVHGRGGQLGATRHEFTLLVPVAQGDVGEWSVSFRGRLDDVDTGVRLPDTGDPFPDELWDLRAGVTYRRRVRRDWIGTLSVTGGSASDRPFASLDEVIASATALLRIPHGYSNAWVAGLTWSNDRAFLNYVPIPLVGYWYQPVPDLLLFAGVPFLLIRTKPVEPLTFQVSYFPTTRVSAQLTYDVTQRLALYAHFRTDEVRYLRADRERRRDGLTFLDSRVAGGVRLALGRQVALDLSAGYAFDKIVYEGEDFDDRDQNRLNIGDGLYWAASLSARF